MLPFDNNGAPSTGPADDRWVAIVDDHASMRSSLARAFRLERIATSTFASAEEYLAHSASCAPCCLILDMQLPGMRGVELAQLLDREHRPMPPVIFISAHEDLLAMLEGSSLAYGRVRKPFDFEVLLALVTPLVHAAPAAATRHSVA